MTALDFLRSAGAAAFGPRWQVPLARALGPMRPSGHPGISGRQVRRWVAGDTPVPAWALSAVPAMLSAQAEALVARADELRRAATSAAAELERISA